MRRSETRVETLDRKVDELGAMVQEELVQEDELEEEPEEVAVIVPPPPPEPATPPEVPPAPKAQRQRPAWARLLLGDPLGR